MYQLRIRISISLAQLVSRSAGHWKRKLRTAKGARISDRLLRPGEVTRRRSPERDGVHQAALGPQGVLTTLQLQRAAHPDVALIDFAVVADLPDNVEGPGIVDAHQPAELTGP